MSQIIINSLKNEQSNAAQRLKEVSNLFGDSLINHVRKWLKYYDDVTAELKAQQKGQTS